jgi:hypothetical protein
MEERIVSTSDFGIQPQVEEREIKIRIKKPRFMAPWIDFGYLWKELKNVKSNLQEPTENLRDFTTSSLNTKTIQTKKPRTLGDLKEIVKAKWFIAGIISFLLFASSSYDLISDGILSYTFLNGTYYTKRFQNRPDSKFYTKLEN